MKASRRGLVTSPLSNPEVNKATGTCDSIQCPVQECTEVFKSDCVIYTGPDLSCQDTTVVNTDDTVTEAIQSVVGYFCANGGGGGVGAQGAQGPQGSQGVQGSQGIQGIQGSIGSQGTQGSQGVQGIQGTRGWQGTQGIQGIQGIQGLQGVQGIQGLQGVQGVQGSKGVNGLQGTQGTQGIPGEFAAQGIQGVQGTQGIQGVQGSKGSQGTIGEQGGYGPTGIQGSQGTQGIQGIGNNGSQGAQGSQGSQGIQGIQGGGFNQSQGTQGTQGLQGTTGTGTQGAQGTQGFQGIQGFQGVQGSQGLQGAQGSRGIQGFLGTQGSQGTQGLNGAFAAQGIPGIQGSGGIQGTEGAQGPAGSGGGGAGGRCSTDATLIASTSGYFISQGDGVTFIGSNELCGWNNCLWNEDRLCSRELPAYAVSCTVPLSIDLAIFDEIRICGTAIFDQFDSNTDSGTLMVGLGSLLCDPSVTNLNTTCLIDPNTHGGRFEDTQVGLLCFDATYVVATEALFKCRNHLIVYLGVQNGSGTYPANIKFSYSLTAVKTCVDTYYDAEPCCGGPNELVYGTYILGATHLATDGKCYNIINYGSAGTPTISLISSSVYVDCPTCTTANPCP